MQKYLLKRKFSILFFLGILAYYSYLQVGGYSVWNTLPTQIEKGTSYGSNGAVHHK